MAALAVCLGIVCLGLIVYIILMNSQIRHISQLLEKRTNQNSSQLVNTTLINKNINLLAADINKSLKAEEQLRLKLIDDEDNFKEMIANISHDLRTPLTSMDGYVQLIEHDENNENQLNRLHIVRKHTKELAALINHFYEYSYLIDSKPAMNKEEFSLTDFATECIAEAVSMFEKADMTVDMDVKEEYVYADKELTMRIMQNLIRNAVSHGRDKTVIRITRDDFVRLHFMNKIYEDEIIDTSRIFDRFYSRGKDGKSTGLGLSIVSVLASLMGGSVKASCKDGMLDICVAFTPKE